jgi:hypothetical protein
MVLGSGHKTAWKGRPKDRPDEAVVPLYAATEGGSIMSIKRGSLIAEVRKRASSLRKAGETKSAEKMDSIAEELDAATEEAASLNRAIVAFVDRHEQHRNAKAHGDEWPDIDDDGDGDRYLAAIGELYRVAGKQYVDPDRFGIDQQDK